MRIQSLRVLTKFHWDFSLCHVVDRGITLGLALLTFLSMNLMNMPIALAATDNISMDLRAVDGNFHLEFSGSSEWDYDLERKDQDGKSIIEMRVPSLKAGTEKALKSIVANEVVESIRLERVPGGTKDILTITLKSNYVESFDYLTEKPSRLVVDLYVNTKKKNNSAVAKKSNSALPAVKTSESSVAGSEKLLSTSKGKKDLRKPAMDEFTKVEELVKVAETGIGGEINTKVVMNAGIFDGGDPNFERFAVKDHEIKEEAIVRSQENLYTPFPMLLVEGVHFEEIKSKPPIYEIAPTNTEENKMARLILTLLEKKRLAVCLKTINWFFAKYKNSEYEEIIRYALGDLYFKLWEKDKNRLSYETSMQAYREALTKYPQSILAQRTKFFIGYASFFNKDYFGALRIFQGYVGESKPSELRDKAMLAVARSLMRLNQFEEAIKTYQQIEKEGFSEANRVEASYLKGDVYYSNKQFKLASEAYRDAVMKYPQAINLYPNAFYNLAESLFWQKLYKAALESYREFLAKFSAHSHAPYAMTRAGETMEILGADAKKVMGAFLEASFRYGGTEGGIVARMRLLSNRMKHMKARESEKAIAEIKSYIENVQLPQIDLFATIMIAEGLSQRAEFESSIKTLLSWYQSNSSTRDANLIRKRIVRHVNEKMRGDVESGNFLDALKLHGEYGELWLKGSGRIDTVYNLGRAFEQAGAYKEADFLFRETSNQLAAAMNSKQALEHSALEYLPTMDETFLRLAKVKMELGENSKSYEYIKSIKEPTKLNESQQIERMEIAMRLLKEKGDVEAAKIYARDLINNWQGKPAKVSSIRLKLAQLELESKEFAKAESLLKSNLSDLEDGQKIPSDEHLQTQKLLSDVYLQADNKKENESVLSDMLEHYGDKSATNAYRYRLGKIYFDEGNMQKAASTWKVLEQKNDSFWWGIAQNHLKEKDWKDTYKKYIERIPAMAKTTEKGKE